MALHVIHRLGLCHKHVEYIDYNIATESSQRECNSQNASFGLWKSDSANEIVLCILSLPLSCESIRLAQIHYWWWESTIAMSTYIYASIVWAIFFPHNECTAVNSWITIHTKYITRIDITARGGIRDKTWKDSNKRRQYWKTNSFTIDLFTSAPLSSISTRHPSKLRILEISVQFTGWLNPPSAMNCNVLWFVFANFQETSNHEFIATLSQLSHNN